MNKLMNICLMAAVLVVFFANGSFAGGVPVPPKCLALGEIINGVPTPDQKCCTGLQLGDLKENYDKHCVNLGAGGYGGICIACGDSICDPTYETACNCPQDCIRVKKEKDNNKDGSKHDKKDHDDQKKDHDGDDHGHEDHGYDDHGGHGG